MYDIQGSPPRMRGKHCAFIRTPIGVGITPADAGKTMSALNASVIVWDHPRGCGENGLTGVTANLELGSPPRMRGKRVFVPQLLAVRGITPADAGKTQRYTANKRERRDHPRGCGENATSQILFTGIIGSPPRMRGKLPVDLNAIAQQRITPADAGKTIKQ